MTKMSRQALCQVSIMSELRCSACGSVVVDMTTLRFTPWFGAALIAELHHLGEHIRTAVTPENKPFMRGELRCTRCTSDWGIVYRGSDLPAVFHGRDVALLKFSEMRFPGLEPGQLRAKHMRMVVGPSEVSKVTPELLEAARVKTLHSKPCRFFNTPRGCRNGGACKFLHIVVADNCGQQPALAPRGEPVNGGESCYDTIPIVIASSAHPDAVHDSSKTWNIESIAELDKDDKRWSNFPATVKGHAKPKPEYHEAAFSILETCCSSTPEGEMLRKSLLQTQHMAPSLSAPHTYLYGCTDRRPASTEKRQRVNGLTGVPLKEQGGGSFWPVGSSKPPFPSGRQGLWSCTMSQRDTSLEGVKLRGK